MPAGYAASAPVLAGALVTLSGVSPAAAAAGDRVAVLAAPRGLALRGAALGGAWCALPDANGTTPAAAPVPVPFGVDVLSTCAVPLLLGAPAGGSLAALCTPTGQAALAAAVGLAPVAPGLPTTHVGIVGNADAGKAWQWQAVALPPPPAAPTFDAAAALCRGLVTGAVLDVLVGRVGEARNPQRKVLAARLTYTTGAVGGAVGAGGGALALRTAVTWTEVNPPAADWLPAAPAVVPPLPADLFYPFMSGSQDELAFVASGAGRARAAAGVAALALASAAALAAGR